MLPSSCRTQCTVRYLELQHGTHYVSCCYAHQLEHYQQQCMGHAAECAREHPPIRLAFTRPFHDPLDEDYLVLQCMREHGIHNVRGGSFSGVHLPPDALSQLRRQLMHACGRCFLCGSPHHMSATCYEMHWMQHQQSQQQSPQRQPLPPPQPACSLLQPQPPLQHLSQPFRTPSPARERRAHTHTTTQQPVQSPPKQPRLPHAELQPCQHCGRLNHTTAECYTNWDAQGSPSSPSCISSDPLLCALCAVLGRCLEHCFAKSAWMYHTECFKHEVCMCM